MNYDYGKHCLEYKFWHEPTCIPEHPRMELLATFTYFQEALDFAKYCKGTQARVVFTGPYHYLQIINDN